MTTDLIPPLNDKGSGIEWLGDVPSHWAVRRLRNTCMMRVSNVDKHKRDGEFPVRLCNYVDVYKNDWIRSQLDFMYATATKDEIERFRLQRGDVLITKDSETWTDIGVPALVESTRDDLVSGYHLALLRPCPKHLNSTYFFRALQSVSIQYQFHIAATGVTRYGLSHNAIKSILLPVPPLTDQIAIVRFLGLADERIRRYIRGKQNLIESLREYRCTIINHAVTRGLDPAVRLNPSGIERLGDVPVHWAVKRIRHTCVMKVSNVDKHKRDDEFPVRLCNSVDVYNNDRIRADFNFMHATATKNEIERFRLHVGDVLITKDSVVWNNIGIPALVDDSSDDLVCGYHLALLRPLLEHLNSTYLFYALQTVSSVSQLRSAASGVTIHGLSGHAIRSVWLPAPPITEQVAIASFLDRVSSDIDRATQSAQQEISLLREYRTRLIADVVTGKLDVREAVNYIQEEFDEANSTNSDDARRDSSEDIGSEVPETES